MARAVGHPVTALIPVHGGEFGNNTEASISQLLVDSFGEGVIEALAEIAQARRDQIAAERAAAEKAESAKLAKEEESKALEEQREALKATPTKHPHAAPVPPTGGKP